MKISIQAAIDQLLEEHTLDLIVDGLANGDFCANIGSFRTMRIWGKKTNRVPPFSPFNTCIMYPDDEMCPTYVNDVIRQGLPLLATMEGLEEGIVLVRLFREEVFSQRQKYHSCSGLQRRSGGNMPCMKMVDSLNVFVLIMRSLEFYQIKSYVCAAREQCQ